MNWKRGHPRFWFSLKYFEFFFVSMMLSVGLLCFLYYAELFPHIHRFSMTFLTKGCWVLDRNATASLVWNFCRHRKSSLPTFQKSVDVSMDSLEGPVILGQTPHCVGPRKLVDIVTEKQAEKLIWETYLDFWSDSTPSLCWECEWLTGLLFTYVYISLFQKCMFNMKANVTLYYQQGIFQNFTRDRKFTCLLFIHFVNSYF